LSVSSPTVASLVVSRLLLAVPGVDFGLCVLLSFDSVNSCLPVSVACC
jgi:hypothetical protein